MGSRLRIASCLAAVVGGALVAGCSQSAERSASASAIVTTTAASASTSAAPTTAISTTTTLGFTTSVVTTPNITPSTVATSTLTNSTLLAATTTVVPIESVPAARVLPTEDTLPRPAAPPADPNGVEAKRQIGTIEIPKINVTKAMFEGVALTTLNRGPGHWPGTAMPGETGNVVIGGHRVSHDRPFRNIDQLNPGDDVFLTTDAGRFDYKVVSSEVVTPDAIRIVDQTPDRTATLFACTPPGSTSHRLVVHLVLSE